MTQEFKGGIMTGMQSLRGRNAGAYVIGANQCGDKRDQS